MADGDNRLFPVFGDWLKAARQDHHLSQKELAGRMGYEISLIRKVEGGQRQPSLAFRQRLAAAFNLPPTAIPDPTRLTFTNIHIPHNNGALPEPGPLSAGSYLPLHPNPLFTGRADLLHQLAYIFTTRRAVCVGQLAAATGLGGIGKTQLAVEFAHRYGRFFPGGVFWLNFADPAAIPAEIARCGRVEHLHLDPQFDQLSQERQVALVQRAWQEAIPRLLIYDNCEEEALLAQWRPATGGCHILITSRCQRWDPVLGVTHLVLDVLSRPQSIFLLRQFVPTLTEAEADAIADALGDLPLALHLAGSYLSVDGATLSSQAYLQQLHQQGRWHHPSLQNGRLSPTRHENNLSHTFALSLRRLDKAQPVDQLALALLRRAVCLAPGQPIPCNLLAATAPPEAPTAAALARLEQLGLVTAGRNENIRLHQLTAEFVQAYGGDHAEAAAVVAQTLLRLTEQGNVARNLYPARTWQVHLRYITETALVQADEAAAALGQALGWHLWLCGDYPEARHFLEKTLTLRRHLLGDDHPDIANTLDSLGRTWQSSSHWQKARTCHEEALAIRRRFYGEQHPLTAESHTSLGLVYQTLADSTMARHHLQTGLSIRLALLGPTHADTGFSYHCLALQDYAEGKYSQAIEKGEKALQIAQTLYGDHHPDTARSLNALGIYHLRMGLYPQARDYYEQALERRKQLLGLEHNDTLTTLTNLGGVLREMGQFEAAQKLFEQGLAVQQVKFGPHHYTTAQNLHNLGALWLEMGQYDQALPHLEHTLNVYELCFGVSHPNTAFPLTSLGLLHHRLGNYLVAQGYFERALALRLEKLGEQHLYTIITVTCLGDLWVDMEEFAAAADCLSRAHTGLKQTPTPNAQVLAQTIQAQGRLKEALGQIDLAQSLYAEALAIRRQLLGPDHPHTRQSLQAVTHVQQGVGSTVYYSPRQ